MYYYICTVAIKWPPDGICAWCLLFKVGCLHSLFTFNGTKLMEEFFWDSGKVQVQYGWGRLKHHKTTRTNCGTVGRWSKTAFHHNTQGRQNALSRDHVSNNSFRRAIQCSGRLNLRWRSSTGNYSQSKGWQKDRYGFLVLATPNGSMTQAAMFPYAKHFVKNLPTNQKNDKPVILFATVPDGISRRWTISSRTTFSHFFSLLTLVYGHNPTIVVQTNGFTVVWVKPPRVCDRDPLARGLKPKTGTRFSDKDGNCFSIKNKMIGNAKAPIQPPLRT
jgi:hypothetical protein